MIRSLILFALASEGLSRTQVICHDSASIEDAVKYLNEKLLGEFVVYFVVYDGVKYNKETEKFEKTQLVIKPKNVSAPSFHPKGVCVTVTD